MSGSTDSATAAGGYFQADSAGTSDPRLTDGPWRRSLDDRTVKAVGELSAALETIEVARGHLYAFHQLTGTADFRLEHAIKLLREAGQEQLAERLSRELLGRNVLPGRWTFQVIEDYEDTYYHHFRSLEREARKLTGGLRHVHEADMKRERRTVGEPGHEATAPERAESAADNGRQRPASSERAHIDGGEHPM